MTPSDKPSAPGPAGGVFLRRGYRKTRPPHGNSFLSFAESFDTLNSEQSISNIGGTPYEATEPLGLRHRGRDRAAVCRAGLRLERAVHAHRRGVHRLDQGPAEPDLHPGDDLLLHRLPAVRPALRQAQRQKRRAPGRGAVSDRLFPGQPLPLSADAVSGLRSAVRPWLRPQLQCRYEHHGALVPGQAGPDLRRAADGLRRRQLPHRQALPGLDPRRRGRLAHQLPGAGRRLLRGAGGVLLLLRGSRRGLHRPRRQRRQGRGRAPGGL